MNLFCFVRGTLVRWVITLACAMAVVAIFGLNFTSPPVPPLSQIVIEKGELDLGEIIQRSDFEHFVTLRNVSQTNSLHLDLMATCQCTALAPNKVHLGPGDAETIKLVVDLKLPPAGDPGALDWPFRLTLIARDLSSEIRRTRAWEFKATVWRPIAAIPPIVDLTGANELYRSASVKNEVRLRSKESLIAILAVVEPPVGVAVVQQDSDGYYLEYTHTNREKIGDIDATIHVTATSSSGETLPTIHIPVKGRVVPDFRIVPSLVSLGLQETAQEIERIVSVTTVGNKPFKVDLPNPLDSKNLRAILLERGDRELEQLIKLTVTLDQTGDQKWIIPVRIYSENQSFDPTEMELKVHGYGIAGNEHRFGDGQVR